MDSDLEILKRFFTERGFRVYVKQDTNEFMHPTLKSDRNPEYQCWLMEVHGPSVGLGASFTFNPTGKLKGVGGWSD